MRQVKKRLVVIAPIIGITILFGWILRFKIIKVYYREQWKKSSPEDMIKKHEKAFLQDRAILSKYDVFKPSKGTNDAGPYLNPMIHWEVGDIHHQGSLVLPLWLHKEMNKDWVNKKPLFKKMGLKFEWMKELQKYDYWNPEANSPAYPAGKKYLTYSFPVPTYKDLVTWAKLRLLYGKETNDMQNAFKEVRHLTRLIWTNDYLVSSVIAVSMLRLEHEVHQGNWEIIPEEDLMRAKRHFYALGNITDAHLSDETWDKMTDTTLGLCPMITEGLMAYISMRDLMKEELKTQYDRMDKLVKFGESKCRDNIVYQMYRDPTWPTLTNDNDFERISETQLFNERLTWDRVKSDADMKVVMGYMLSGVAAPMFFGGYEK
jgi:hypothetical protein